MAYLLHPSSFAAPSTQNNASGGNTPGIDLFAPAYSLLQGIHAVIRGQSSRGVRKESDASPSSSASQQRARGGLSGGAMPGTPSAVGVVSSTKDERSGYQSVHAGQRELLSPTARATRHYLMTREPALPARRGTSGTAPVPSAAGYVQDPVTTTDAELYRRAVDFSDVEEVLRYPLPPVKGCSTPFAYGGNHMRGDMPASALSLSTSPSSACSSAGVSPTPPLTFRCIGADPDTGITIYSTPVEDCPMHLMRAYAILPCAPRDVLLYMDNNIRPLWDSYIRSNTMLRELQPPEEAAKVANTYQLSSSIGTAGAGVGRQSPTSLFAQAQVPLTASSSNSTAAAFPPAASAGFAYQPGQRRVAIHYLETRSPVPFVQDRDFELVVAEAVLPDGTACSKAFSTPFGYHKPLDPQQSRYVRAVVLLSGLIARPLDPAAVDEVLPPVLRRHRASFTTQAKRKGNSKAPQSRHPHEQQQPPPLPPQPPSEYCVLEYIGLVHPMGMLPAVLVNMVISAQLNAMRKMQAFIARRPMSTLLPRVSSVAVSLERRPALRATVPPLKELSAVLRASPSAALSPSPTPAHDEEQGGTQVSAAASAVNNEPVSGNADAASAGVLEEGARWKGKRTKKEEAGEAAEGQQRKAAASWWPWRPRQLLSRL